MTASRRNTLADARVLVRGFILIATLVGIGAVLDVLGFRDMLGTNWIDAQVRGKGLAGEATFLAAAAVFTAIGLPRQVPSFLAGYAFGLVHGTALGLLATLAGAAAAFQYARFMGRAFLLRRFPGHMQKIDGFLADNTATMAMVLRLSPFTNNLATNLAAGVSGVRMAPFVAGSALGYLPQTLVFALLGSGFALDPALRWGGSVVLFVVSSILGMWLWRRARRTRRLPGDGSAVAPAGSEG
ncbi:MAG: VTT domain-containing protein [Magnetospirillum sp.]|nr:VTT domain-containing protein [Magnetospirillum sp.]